MTHTLHEQYGVYTTNEEFGEILQNELGFTADADKYFIGENDRAPYIKVPAAAAAQVCFYNGAIAINGISVISSAEKIFYWHNSSDLSVRHMSASAAVVWAQDINGEWSAISVNSFVPSGSMVKLFNAYTQTNLNNVDANGIYTLTKIARTDNGVPFKGLYMVTSARSFFERDTLVNVNGDIFRFVTLNASSGNKYPTLAFKVAEQEG
ncbi:MAG: hypothetical protein NC395_12035 [Prevotella sp.]|nr:hypothetical protein [Prevotella sp.]